MKTLLVLACLCSLLSPATIWAASNGLHCEAIKKLNLETGGVIRGLSVIHAVEHRNEAGVLLKTTRRTSQKIWFGENASLRDQAGAFCKQALAQFECRHDGQKSSSYIRGGSVHVTQNWVLHSTLGHHESFSEGGIPFGENGFLRCHDRILEIVTSQIQNQFLN